MKSLILSLSFAILSLLAQACHQKKSEIEPYPSVRIMGYYRLSYLYGNGKAVSLSSNTSTIFVESKGEKLVHLSMTTGNIENEIGTYQVRKAANQYILNDGINDSGIVENNTLKIDLLLNGSKYYIEAIAN